MKPEAFIILSPGFPKNESDSTCLPSQQLFVHLLTKKYPGIEIIVMAFQYPFIQAVYDWKGCRVIALGGKGKGKIFRLLLWRRAWIKLNKIAREKKIIGLLSFWCGECALIGKRFGRKYRIDHKCWILGQDAKKENHYVRKIRPKPAELIAMSDFLQQTFSKNHSIQPAFVVPNGIDPRSFPSKRLLRDIELIAVASLIPLKQFTEFIEVVAQIKNKSPDLRALICGKGPEENALQELINNKGLQENINLTGELSHQEVIAMMQRSKIMIHCSAYEGFPTVCLEALGAGTPVISFIQPMNNAIPNWHIVKDRNSMAEKVMRILDEPAGEYPPLFPFLMKDSVNKMMHLFGL